MIAYTKSDLAQNVIAYTTGGGGRYPPREYWGNSIHITCLEIRETGVSASNGTKKTGLPASSKTLENIGKQLFGQERGGKEKTNITV